MNTAKIFAVKKLPCISVNVQMANMLFVHHLQYATFKQFLESWTGYRITSLVLFI